MQERDRVREPEGRRREDDDDAQPRRRVQGAGATACSLVDLDPQGNLTMSQGMNPDAIERSMFDVLVHRVPITRSIHRAEVDVAVVVDRPRRRGARALVADRPRAGAREGARRGARPLRLHPDRHAALARAADDQRVRRRDRRDRAGAVRVPLAARARAAREHARDGAREPQPAASRVEGILPTMFDGRTLHSREAIEILEENFGELVYKHAHPQDGPLRRGAREGLSRCSSTTPAGPAAEAYRELWRRRCSMARKRASMREGPLAELFRATEAAQRQPSRSSLPGSSRPSSRGAQTSGRPDPRARGGAGRDRRARARFRP